MSIIYDVIVVGMGMGGVYAALKLSNEYKKMKILGIEAGRAFAKRRLQVTGTLGCFPFGDGKLYQNDLQKVIDLTSVRKAKKANTFFKKTIQQVNDYKIIKDKLPTSSLLKKIDKLGYEFSSNDFIQIYPKEIHTLSKYMVNQFEKNNNIDFAFDTEVKKIYKQRGTFIIVSDTQEFRAKKVILAIGRAGWKTSATLFKDLGIIEENDTAKFGIRTEISSTHMRDFNRSACTLTRGDIEIGPLSWSGTVIPVDMFECAVSDFRSNESRWKTDKVSFQIIGNRKFPNAGFEQTDRLANLTWILSNERISKERMSLLLNGKSKISILHEYNWLKPVITELSAIIPEITAKAYFHVPTVMPYAPKVALSDNLETEIDGLYVIGESAGVYGLLSAALMGIIVADQI